MQMLSSQQVKDIIIRQLPHLFKKDEEVKSYIIHLVEKLSAPRKQTGDRFEQLMNEIITMRKESEKKWETWEKKWETNEKKWDEEKVENEKKWEEDKRRWEEHKIKSDDSDRRYEENQKVIRTMLKRLDRLDLRYAQGIGAVGERWGIYAEGTFRNAMATLLHELSGYKVEHFEETDVDGEVFGLPSQIEIDMIINNGKTFIVEIKSSMSKGDMFWFWKKSNWVKKKKGIKLVDLVVISPMIHPRAKELAITLGIRCFSYAEEINLTI